MTSVKNDLCLITNYASIGLLIYHNNVQTLPQCVICASTISDNNLHSLFGGDRKKIPIF